jgi:hypothetical protein
MMKKILLFLLIAIQLVAVGQETEENGSGKFLPNHSFGLTIGHEHAFSGRDADGNKKTQIMPFWGIDYNLQFAPKFMIGLHTDIVMESFKVEKDLAGGEEEVVERSRPVAPALMFFYKPTGHWSLGFGVGGEFAKEENYSLTRLAVEYGSEIRNGWEVFGSLQYDLRWNAYDTWTIGLGISKAVGHHKERSE